MSKKKVHLTLYFALFPNDHYHKCWSCEMTRCRTLYVEVPNKTAYPTLYYTKKQSSLSQFITFYSTSKLVSRKKSPCITIVDCYLIQKKIDIYFVLSQGEGGGSQRKYSVQFRENVDNYGRSLNIPTKLKMLNYFFSRSMDLTNVLEGKIRAFEMWRLWRIGMISWKHSLQ